MRGPATLEHVHVACSTQHAAREADRLSDCRWVTEARRRPNGGESMDKLATGSSSGAPGRAACVGAAWLRLAAWSAAALMASCGGRSLGPAGSEQAPDAGGSGSGGSGSAGPGNGAPGSGGSGSGGAAPGSSGSSGGSPAASSGSSGGAGSSGGGASSGATASSSSGGASSSSGAGSSSSSGSSGGVTCQGLAANEELIDDMNNGSPSIPNVHGRAGSWQDADDATGASLFPPVGGPFQMSDTGDPCRLLAVRTYGGPFLQWGATVYVGLGAPYNASAYKGVSFWAKAGASSSTGVRIAFPDKDTDPAGASCSTVA